MARRKKGEVFDRTAKGRELLRKARRKVGIGAVWRMLEEKRVAFQAAHREKKKNPRRGYRGGDRF